MKRSTARDLLVAQASSPWGDQASCPVIATETTGKVSVGPTAKMAVLLEDWLAELAPVAANP
jgi:hypothetical protein